MIVRIVFQSDKGKLEIVFHIEDVKETLIKQFNEMHPDRPICYAYVHD